MNRTQFNKALVPGLFSFMSESFRIRSEEGGWRDVVDKVGTSRREFEESAYFAGLGTLPGKDEGAPITYDDMLQGFTKRWIHKTYGLGVRVTEELIEDTLYPEIPTQMEAVTKELGRSAAETITLLVFDVYNSGTGTTTHTAGDALAIFSGTHTSLRGGTWSNLITPAADLSATTLQTAIDNFENTKDDTGKYQLIKARDILVNPSNAWKAKELLNSAYDPETPNNAINALKERNLRLLVSPFYTDADAFTLRAEPAHSNGGVIAYLRRKPTFAKDGDFETGDAKFKATFRFSVEVNKPNNLYHSAGA